MFSMALAVSSNDYHFFKVIMEIFTNAVIHRKASWISTLVITKNTRHHILSNHFHEKSQKISKKNHKIYLKIHTTCFFSRATVYSYVQVQTTDDVAVA